MISRENLCKRMLRRASPGTLLALGLLLALSVAFVPTACAGEPCCSVTAINKRTGVVTAYDATTKRSFQFKVTNAKLLKTLKTGQKVWADFGTRKVSVDGGAPCCGITSVAAVGTAADVGSKVYGALPCCDITAIDTATGVVTAFSPENGRHFRFKVGAAALLKTLKVGQKVWVNSGTRKVSVDGLQPCCSMLNP